MRDFLKVLPLGLFLPLVLGAASVKPDDAMSNISAWAHSSGFEAASRWLANPAADNRIIIASAAASAVYSFVVFTVPLLKEHRNNPSDRLKNHFLAMAFYIFCIALVVAVWRIMPSPQSSAISATQPAPRASASPSPPLTPWVSAEEIEAARKVGRTLLPFKSEELASMGISSGANNMTAYVGKWVKVVAPFKQLTKKSLGDKKEYLIVIVYDRWESTLLFDSKKWEDRLVQFKSTDRIAALCQLYGFNADASAILWNCELS